MNIIWVAWEEHRRTKELAGYFNIKLFILESKWPRAIKYPILIYKTLLTYLKHKPDIVFVQNPSIVLALFSCYIKKIFKFKLVADMHNAAIVPDNTFQQYIYPMYRTVFKKADLCIVTNNGLKEKIIPYGNTFVLPDRLPAISQNFQKNEGIQNNYFVFICTFGIDEPFNEVIEAARLTNDMHIYVTGNHKKCPDNIKNNLPDNVTFTGYLAEKDYLDLLYFSDGVIDLTNRENCLVCGAYEAVSLEKPLILSNTKALKKYFTKGVVFCENERSAIKDATIEIMRNKSLYESEIKELKNKLNSEWKNYSYKLLANLGVISSSNKQAELHTNMLLRLGDYATKERVVHFYEFYQKCQWWSKESLLDYQDMKLRELIKISLEEVPFYKSLYGNQGIRAEEIRTQADLVKLPLVSKAELKKFYPQYCTRITPWPVKEYFTSGSSGNPFAVLVDNLTMSQARALMLLRANYSGWEIGDPIFQTGMTLERGVVKKLKDILFNVYYASAYDLSDKNLDKYLDIIERKNIKFLMGYPGSILALADRAGRIGFNSKMNGITTWGDNLFEHYRKKIELQFQCRVTDTYGCGEGIQVAAQCPEGYGHYHIFMPHVIVEIVDDYGQPVKRGENGNILLTRLEPGAMPLIRYKVGDIGRMSTVEQCECGRGFDILEKIEGRDSDIIHTPNGNKLIVHFFTGIFEYYPEIRQFCVYQHKIEEIEVQIVPQGEVGQQTLDNIRDEIIEKGDRALIVNFKIVNKIEDRKTGKRRFVISNLSI